MTGRPVITQGARRPEDDPNPWLGFVLTVTVSAIVWITVGLALVAAGVISL